MPGCDAQARPGKQRLYLLEENTPIADGMFRMRLVGDTAGFAPGRFVNILVPQAGYGQPGQPQGPNSFFLRRPIAICDWDTGGFTLACKLVGGGTRALSALKPGTTLDVLAPLGNGFGVGAAAPGGASARAGASTCACLLLIGGGCGVGPLVGLAKALRAEGRRVKVALGFATAGQAYLCGELAALAEDFYLTTQDGTRGEAGLVTGVLERAAQGCAGFYACGPTGMLKAVCSALVLPGQLSLEERMACGFGGCVGCAIPTRDGMRRVCADGPVFDREVLAWDV